MLDGDRDWHSGAGLLPRYSWDSADSLAGILSQLCAGRSSVPDAGLTQAVAGIIEDIARNGDDALMRYARQWDGLDAVRSLEGLSQAVPVEAAGWLDADDRQAVEQAMSNVRAFHHPQASSLTVETVPGVVCQRVFRPLRRVGLYIPAGSAPLVSTLVMLAVPAQLAGVSELVVCCPLYRGDERIQRTVMAVAALLGIDRLWCIGGAQAVAAMAVGTNSLPAVQKICGPGNAYVTEAKRQVMVSGTPIDMLAGPSEVMVLAGVDSNPEWVAWDLLAQAEHDERAQVVLVALSDTTIDSVMACLSRYVQGLPRGQVARASLSRGAAICVKDWQQAIDLANGYAAEHLVIHPDAGLPPARIDDISCAGSVFWGGLAAEALGDYASGPNHVLPTGGQAATVGGVGVETFGRMMTVQTVTPAGLERLSPTVQRMAVLEGLEAHRRSVAERLTGVAVGGCNEA